MHDAADPSSWAALRLSEKCLYEKYSAIFREHTVWRLCGCLPQYSAREPPLASQSGRKAFKANDEADLVAFGDLVQLGVVKRCPNWSCRVPIEKNGGVCAFKAFVPKIRESKTIFTSGISQCARIICTQCRKAFDWHVNPP
jgi:hypothetical protein